MSPIIGSGVHHDQASKPRFPAHFAASSLAHARSLRSMI
jgi:hypothetical protein